MTACVKVRYRTERDAQIALVGILVDTNRRSGPRKGGLHAKTESRIYQCPHCLGGWHLTSQPREVGRRA